MTRHRTPAERLSICREVGELETTAEKRARLLELGVGWATYFRWLKLYEAHGRAGLQGTRPTGRPRSEILDRLDALEGRVEKLEQALEGRGGGE